MYALHPSVVHFPVALLVLSAVLEVFAATTGRIELSRFGWWVQIAGTVTVLATVATGLIAAHQTPISPAAGEAFDTHQLLAFLTASAYSALVIWRGAKRGRVPTSPSLYLLVLAAATLLLLATAWYGGELVYRFGTGIQAP